MYVFNALAWDTADPDSVVYDKASSELNALIVRDFPELSVEDLWEIRTEITNEKERVKRLFGIN